MPLAIIHARLSLWWYSAVVTLNALVVIAFERVVVALSTARPVYWVQAEPRTNPAEQRLRLTVCENGSITSQRPLGHYHPHGDWL